MADWDSDVSNNIAMETLYEEEDYQEEEVWAVLKEKEGSNSSKASNKAAAKEHSSSGSSSPSAWGIPAAPRAIPRAKSGSNLESTKVGVAKPLSAPVNIPNWSTIYKKDLNKRLWDDDNDDDGFKKIYNRVVADAVDEDDDDVADEMVPPHEYIDRRLKRNQIVSFSMLEGIGRTLKGRDLSEVRNAILYKTGFLE